MMEIYADIRPDQENDCSVGGKVMTTSAKQPDMSRSTSYCSRTPLLDVKNKTAHFNTELFGSSKEPKSATLSQSRLDALNLQTSETPKRQKKSSGLRRSCFAAFQPQQKLEEGTRKLTVTLPSMVEEGPNSPLQRGKTRARETKTPPNSPTFPSHLLDRGLSTISEASFAFDTSVKASQEIVQNAETYNSHGEVSNVSLYESDQIEVGNDVTVSYNSMMMDGAQSNSCEGSPAIFKRDSSGSCLRDSLHFEDGVSASENRMALESDLDANALRSSLIAMVEAETDNFVDMLLEECASELVTPIQDHFAKDHPYMKATAIPTIEDKTEAEKLSSPAFSSVKTPLANNFQEQSVRNSTPKSSSRSLMPFQSIQTPLHSIQMPLHGSPLDELLNLSNSSFQINLQNADLSELMETYLLNSSCQSLEGEKESLSSSSVNKLLDIDLSPKPSCPEEVTDKTANNNVTEVISSPYALSQTLQDHFIEKISLENPHQEFLLPKELRDDKCNSSHVIVSSSVTASNQSVQSTVVEILPHQSSLGETTEANIVTAEDAQITSCRNTDSQMFINESIQCDAEHVKEPVKSLPEEMEASSSPNKNIAKTTSVPVSPVTSVPVSPLISAPKLQVPQLNLKEDSCLQLHSSVEEASLSPGKRQELSQLISDIDAQISLINYSSISFTPGKAVEKEIIPVSVGTSPFQFQDANEDSFNDVSLTKDHFQLVLGVNVETTGKDDIMPQITGLDKSMLTEKTETVNISTNTSLTANQSPGLGGTYSSIMSDQPQVQILDKSMSTDKTETVCVSTNTSLHEQGKVFLETTSIATNTSLHEQAEVSLLTDQCRQILVDRSMVTDAIVQASDARSVTDVSMVTETAVTLDHSMMAVPDALNKQTMTDRKSVIDAESSMTPLKLNNKQGKRLTAEEVRRQHPRAVANHMETLMSTNQRLEKEVKTACHERDRLKSVLKDTKSRLTGTETELGEVKLSQEKHIAMLEQLQEEATIGLQTCIEEKQNRIYNLEEEIKESKARCQQAEENLARKESELLVKCEHLEKLRHEAELHFEEQIKSLTLHFEENNYKHQFQASQIVIQELQAERAEFVGLMEDIEKTAALQSRLKNELDKMASKTQKSAKDHAAAHKHLLIEYESLRNQCTAQDIDLEIAMSENKELEEEISRVNNALKLKTESFDKLNVQYSSVSQELLMSQAQISQLSEDLDTALSDVNNLTETKQLLISQLLEQQDSETLACEALEESNEKVNSLKQQLEEEKLSFISYKESHEKLKTDWEEMRSKMELYIQNLQHTLDSWEVDRELQDEELYECRQQLADRHVKIDTMTNELSALRKIKATTQADKDLMAELKNTNQFLEAEKSLYLEAITDFRTKLESETELTKSKQHLIEALRSSNTQLHESCEQLKLDLQMLEEELSAKATEMDMTWKALETLEENMESVLSTLQHKFGIEVKCDSSKKNTSKTKYSTPQKTSSTFRHGYSLVAQVLSKADSQLNNSNSSKSSSFMHQGTEDRDNSFTSSCVHPKQSNVEYGAPQKHLGAAAAAFLSPHSHSFSVSSQRANIVECQAKSVSFCHPHEVFKSVNDSSPSEKLNKTVPGFAKIRSIPSTVERTSQKLPTGNSGTPKVKGSSLLSQSTSSSLASPSSDYDILSAKVKAIDRLFTQILKTADIAERQSELTIKDLKGNIEILNDKLRFQVRQTNDVESELEKKREMLINANSQIKELSTRVSGMTQSILNFQDQSYEIGRLEESKGELKLKIHDLEGKCKLLTEQLEDVIRKMDSTAKGQKPDGACLREIVALKNKNHELLMKLFEEKNRHKEIGDKAVKRLVIFEDNWHKAEAEVQRFDDLVESIRQTCIKHQSQSTHPALLKIVRLIDGQHEAGTSSESQDKLVPKKLSYF